MLHPTFEYLRRLRSTKYTPLSSEPAIESSSTLKASPAKSSVGALSWPNVLLVFFLCFLTAAGGYLLGLQGRHDKRALPDWAYSMPRGTLKTLLLVLRLLTLFQIGSSNRSTTTDMGVR